MFVQTFFYLLFLNFPIFALGRRGGGSSGGGSSDSSSGSGSGSNSNSNDGGASVDVDLDLSSISTATFSFCIIFAVFIAFQALGAIGALRSKNIEDRYPRRLVFSTIILFATLSLVATYTIRAIIVAIEYKESGPSGSLSNVVFAMSGFTMGLADMFITGGLLLLLDGCPNYNLLGSLSESSRKVTQNIKRGIDIALLLLILISNVVLTSFHTTSTIIRRRRYLEVTTGFQRVYIAAFFLISLDILITATLLSRSPKASEIDEMFRSKVLKLIMISTVPFLLILASFNIGEYIATSVILGYDYFVFLLVDTIVGGLLYFVIIGSCLHLGPKRNTESDEDSDKSLKN